MDLTYLPMRHGFLYLVAVLDWATRRVLAWRLSNTLTTDCCLDALEAAIRDLRLPRDPEHRPGEPVHQHGLRRLVQQHGIHLSMDGKGAWRDNLFVERLWKSVKYEEVYLHAYDSVPEAQQQPGPVLHLLQRGPAALGPGRPDPGYGLLRRAASARGGVT